MHIWFINELEIFHFYLFVYIYIFMYFIYLFSELIKRKYQELRPYRDEW